MTSLDKYILTIDDVLPIDTIGRLVKVLSVSDFNQATVGEEQVNLEVRRTFNLNLYRWSSSLTNVHWYNLLNKIEFPENIDSNLLDTYVVQSREALTTSSFNIYGNITSWWLLFLLNKEVINSRFYVEGGDQLEYILPSKVDLVFQQITKTTAFNNKHF